MWEQHNKLGPRDIELIKVTIGSLVSTLNSLGPALISFSAIFSLSWIETTTIIFILWMILSLKEKKYVTQLVVDRADSSFSIHVSCQGHDFPMFEDALLPRSCREHKADTALEVLSLLQICSGSSLMANICVRISNQTDNRNANKKMWPSW